MAINPDDFDKPVKDYQFDKLIAVNELINSMSNAGGFTATKLAHARDLLKIQFNNLEESNYDSKKCLLKYLERHFLE